MNQRQNSLICLHCSQGSYSSGKNWKKGLFEKNQGEPGKQKEFSDHFYGLKEN